MSEFGVGLKFRAAMNCQFYIELHVQYDTMETIKEYMIFWLVGAWPSLAGRGEYVSGINFYSHSGEGLVWVARRFGLGSRENLVGCCGGVRCLAVWCGIGKTGLTSASLRDVSRIFGYDTIRVRPIDISVTCFIKDCNKKVQPKFF